MKKLLLVSLLVFFVQIRAASAQSSRRTSVSVGVSRSAPVTDIEPRLKQFSGGVTLTFRINKKWSFNAGLSKSFDRRPATFRTGISLKIY